MSEDDPTDEEYPIDPPDADGDDAGPGTGIDPPGSDEEGIEPPERDGSDPDRADVVERAREVDHENRDGPLADVAQEVDRLRERDRDPAATDLFDEAVEDADVDREALWRQVAGEEAAERVAEADPEVDVGGPRVERPGEDRTERIVEKKKYCQGCEHFSPPPDVRCTHEGTTIAELVDVDTFRVIDCPVVAEDEELERI